MPYCMIPPRLSQFLRVAIATESAVAEIAILGYDSASPHSPESIGVAMDEVLNKQTNRSLHLKTWGPAVLAIAVAAAASPWLVGPACPKHVVIATGSSEGAYYAFAEKYRDVLARDGITLEIRNTAGSIENSGLLLDDGSGVSLAFMQGGTGSAEAQGHVDSLATLYLEPIWVFVRGEQTAAQLTDLRGKRISIGPQGSGTRAVAQTLLQRNEISDADAHGTQLVSLGSRDSVDALKSGEIDAAFFVVSPNSKLVPELLAAEDISLMNFGRATAYERLFPFLSSVTLAEGMLDLDKNIPAQNIVLLAPTANLVARSDLHPALVPLLMKATYEVHADGGFLEHAGDFPSAAHVEFPLNRGAKQYLTSGPTMFYKYLPFWLAAWLNQVKLVLLPLCTLALPLLKAAPPVYRWRIRSKIYRWYRVLREVDQKVKQTGAQADYHDEIARLESVENELSEVSVPLSYMEEFYNLRLHISVSLDRLRRLNSKTHQPLRRAA